jgi:hypothetical protein
LKVESKYSRKLKAESEYSCTLHAARFMQIQQQAASYKLQGNTKYSVKPRQHFLQCRQLQPSCLYFGILH